MEGGEILLEDEPGEPAHAEIPLTLVDGVSQDAVLLQPRGDATFGLGAQP